MSCEYFCGPIIQAEYFLRGDETPPNGSTVPCDDNPKHHPHPEPNNLRVIFRCHVTVGGRHNNHTTVSFKAIHFSQDPWHFLQLESLINSLLSLIWPYGSFFENLSMGILPPTCYIQVPKNGLTILSDVQRRQTTRRKELQFDKGLGTVDGSKILHHLGCIKPC